MAEGIKFGTNVRDLRDMELIGAIPGGKRFYKRKGEKKKILEADIDVVTYGFYKDRFEDVHIHFHSYSNFAKLRKILFWAYGTGHQPNRSLEKYYWYGDRVFRFLTYDRISGKGVIGYIFKPIYKEEQEDRKLIQQRYKEMVGYFKNVKKYGSKLVG